MNSKIKDMVSASTYKALERHYSLGRGVARVPVAPAFKKEIRSYNKPYNSDRMLLELLDAVGPLERRSSFKVLPNLSSGVELTPILCLSDLHFGEVIKRNGEVIFNLSIAHNRLKSVVSQAIEAQELLAYDVNNIVVLLGGDIIDGELIYPGQSFDTSGDVFSQLEPAINSIWDALLTLQNSFGSVDVYCAAGNHGRTSKIHSPMSNWDNVLYLALRLMAQNYVVDGVRPITITTPEHMWIDFRVRNWNVHMRHIGVNQIATAGPGRRMMTWLHQHDADLMFYGHFHNPEMFSMGHRRIFKNGALPPGNDYSDEHGFLESPGQWLVGVSDIHSVAFAKVLVPRNV